MYKMKTAPAAQLYFNYKGLIDTAYKIYLKQNHFEHLFNFVIKDNEEVSENEGVCNYYYGEPVTTEQGKGFLVDVFTEAGEVFAKVKLSKGFCKISLNKDKQIKETLKNEVIGDGMIQNVPTKKNSKTICGKCMIF